ncbi:MAG: pseudouridine-5'-phosphate glycosidase [Candidatus Acidiferrales bacterium]
MARAPSWLRLSAAVRAARQWRRPVVALETAVLTHGLPPAERVPMAAALEATVRRAGAVAAFIALLRGKACVGLTEREVESLAEPGATVKCARADLGWVLSQKAAAGTTVSATIYVAAQAGIEVAATGGIGGVHRDAADTFDVSADLVELARTPVALVCSGAKSIVDLRKTQEFLESRSVPLIGFQTRDFPGFFTRDTHLPLRATAREVGELAAAVRAYRQTGYKGGILILNPIPAEAALAAGEVESLVAKAVKQASEQGIAGAEVTPFLLEAMNRLSGGATLRANMALLRSNAELAAQLAVALRKR